MKAVVLHEADAMRVEQRPMPEPGPGEVLLKVNVPLDTVWLEDP